VELLSVFADSSYQIRSGWKFLGYSAILVGLFLLTANVFGIFLAYFYPAAFTLAEGDIRYLGINAIVVFVPAAGALLITGRFLDQIPLTGFGVALHKRWFKDFSAGMAVAGGMLVVTLGGSFLFGTAHIKWTGSSAAVPLVALTLAILAVSAFNEELIFRGYPLQILMKALRPWGSMILISSLFGLLHWRNPGASKLSILNTILAGIMLALAYWRTRSIWFPYGIHFGWNAGTSVLLGYPVSGLNTVSVFTTQVEGSTMLHGGAYGPEAGLLGTGLFIVAAAFVYRIRGLSVSPEVQASIAANSGKLYIEK
jgi:membrane protease YdiL (CAAX protease family)